MILLTQIFRKDESYVKQFLKRLQAHLFEEVYLFTDILLDIRNPKIIQIKRDVRFKWKSVFEYVKSNEYLNSTGVYILEPDNLTNATINKDGITVFNNGVYVRNIEVIPKVRRNIFESYEFLSSNIGDSKLNIAIVVHLYYEDMLDDILDRLSSLDMPVNYRYYFTLVNGSSTISQKRWIEKRILSRLPESVIIKVDNKGLDIGGFFKTLEYIYSEGRSYNYILKLHTKKSLLTSGKYFGNRWNSDLLQIVNDNVYPRLISGSDMIGSSKWLISDNLNRNLINQIEIPAYGNKFIGGTMFWVKYDIIKTNITQKIIDKYYPLLEDGYTYQLNSDNELYTHSFERILGYLVREIDTI